MQSAKKELFEKVIHKRSYPKECRITTVVKQPERIQHIMENQYKELRDRQQAEVNAFPLMFAFNENQFCEGMKKLGLHPTDTHKISSIGAGGFCRKADIPALNKMFRRHRKELWDGITADKTGQAFIYDMFIFELNNHEYIYTGDVQDTLDSLGITSEHLLKISQLKKGLQLACEKIMQCDCFN